MSFLWMFLFLSTLNPMRHSYVEGFRTLDKNSFGPKMKGTVKTIEALECADIIDCVDFYKQPAFDNPMILKDFKNKMMSSSFPTRFNKTRSHQPQFIQTWRKYGECPKGTVPIKRTLENNDTIHHKNNRRDREYAIVGQRVNKGNGGKAKFNLWNPRVEGSNEFSLAQMWVSAGDGPELNTVEAGWMVHPALYNDALTRLFAYWTADDYVRTGCYNTVCSGFVKLTREMALGASLEPVSVYNRNVSVIEFIISRTGEQDWYLEVGGLLLGYFPGSLFTKLDEGADEIQFGGEIVNARERHRHTGTQMGSGRFSSDGYRKASFISNIKVANANFEWVEPNLQHTATSPACYDVTLGPPGTRLGSYFYFGGPGFHRGCQ